jgi:hypothetical protein
MARLLSGKTGTIARLRPYPYNQQEAGTRSAKEAAMRTETAIERLRRDLHRVLDNMRADLNRIEILTAALSAFGRPVPAYEPGFRHLRNLTLGVHKIG